MQSLRDKLLKAGLISESVARPDAEPKRGPSERGGRPGGGGQGGGRGGPGGGRHERAPSSSGPIPKLPPLAVPNNKEFQRLEAKKQLELDRKIRELVSAAQVAPNTEGGHTFFFVTRKNRLRRIEMAPEMAGQLERGELAVVERPDPGQIEHAIVPAHVAEEVMKLQERSVRFFNRQGSPVGFLSDEELSRRQKAEASRPPEGEENAPSSSASPSSEPGEGAVETAAPESGEPQPS